MIKRGRFNIFIYYQLQATLTLPTKPVHSRYKSATFVLEAPSHVIDHLVDKDQYSQLQDVSYGSSEVSHSKATKPHIEGVVDLDAVSHLVPGVTVNEFVDLIQQNMPPTLNNAELGGELNEEVDEEQSFLRKSSYNDETSCLVVPSDPFMNVIAEFQHDSVIDYTGFSSVNEPKTENDCSISAPREAYLLSIPTNEQGDHRESHYTKDGVGSSVKAAENVFVLAVPDAMTTMNRDENVLGSPKSSFVTNISNAGYTRREELQSMIEHAFDPLPTDVQHIELRVSTAIAAEGSILYRPGEDVHLDVVVDRKVPLIGYIILVSGLFALSSIGVAFDLQQGGVTPEMKAFWRFTATAVMFLILSAKSLTREELDKFTLVELWFWVPFAGVNYGFMCTAFVVALDMTSLVNAFSKCSSCRSLCVSFQHQNSNISSNYKSCQI
jgi:hypothetical protein